jgi:hypothetical protein
MINPLTNKLKPMLQSIRLTLYLLLLSPALGAQVFELSDDESAKESKMNTEDLATMMAGDPVEAKEEYVFQNRFVILTETMNRKGKVESSYEMTMLTADEESVMGVRMNREGVQTELIYDMEAGSMLTLMNTGGQKMGTSTQIDKAILDETMNESKADDREVPAFEKTGNTKEISGYSCDEYVVTSTEGNDGAKMVYWITEETDADWVRSMANMSTMNRNMPDLYTETGYPEDGAVIQMIVTEEKGDSMKMTVKEAETGGRFVISTKGYSFMNLGGR